jgi:hypothetical protein
MPKGRHDGWLVLADISGYTAFLTGTEIEHAHAILEDLMRGLLASFHAPLRVVKLEGDAIFAYALDADVPDGRAILDRLEDAYHGFRMQLFNVARSSTCTCSACKGAPSLDLKFVVHHGEFVVHDLAGHDDLQGKDVIVVHRLLKNEVEGRAYLLATDAARTRIPGAAWREHAESYEHLGEVKCGTRDLHAVFEELTASGAADVASADADVEAVFDVEAPPEVVWDWHIDGTKAVRWQAGLDGWTVTPNADGRVRPGAMVHCAHGSSSKDMRVLGWRPPRSATFEAEPMGFFMPPVAFTNIIEPLPGGRSRVIWRMKLRRRTLFYRVVMAVLGLGFGRAARSWGAKLNELLATEAPRAVDPPREPASDASPQRSPQSV